MSPHADAEVVVRLQDLQNGYAYALDRRDSAALVAVFHSDATIRVFPPDSEEPAAESRGHAAIALMPSAMIERYERTMHVITNMAYVVDGESARGSAYCVAYHVIADDGAVRTFVTHLRYDDEFGQEPDGDWRITKRDIRFLWAGDGSPPLPWQVATERGRFV